MSTAKRFKRRQAEVQPTSALPASKRLKPSSHVSKKSGLDFLVDEDARANRRLEAKLTNGIPSKRSLHIDESQTVVTSNPSINRSRQTSQTHDVIDISSDDGDAADDSSSMGSEEAALLLAEENESKVQTSVPRVERLKRDVVASSHVTDVVANGTASNPTVHSTAGTDAEVEDEPTFGDLLQARHPEPVDVLATYHDSRDLNSSNGGRYQPAPSSGSLGTVLTQALKTNDSDLLESCFRVTNVESIHSTIQRLPSQHVGALLQRIAERIHNHPGRAGTLTIWIQWALVAHGGYLAGQPELMKKLKALSGVLRERASGLQSLLHLKGKLDMLSAQLELRRKMQAASRAANADELDDEEGVLYIEGQASDWSDDETTPALTNARASNGGLSSAPPQSRKLKPSRIEAPESSNDDEDDAADVEMTNGVSDAEEEDDDDEGVDDDDEEAEDSAEDENDLLDVEAEETSDDDAAASDDDGDNSDVSEEEEEDEDDEEEDVDSEVEGVQPARHSTLSRKR